MRNAEEKEREKTRCAAVQKCQVQDSLRGGGDYRRRGGEVLG